MDLCRLYIVLIHDKGTLLQKENRLKKAQGYSVVQYRKQSNL